MNERSRIGIVRFHLQRDGLKLQWACRETLRNRRAELAALIRVLNISAYQQECLRRGILVKDTRDTVLLCVRLSANTVVAHLIGLKDGAELIVVLLRERIVFVIVAPRAF